MSCAAAGDPIVAAAPIPTRIRTTESHIQPVRILVFV
jgi:hypothetical protein